MNSKRLGSRMMCVSLAGRVAADMAEVKREPMLSESPYAHVALHEAGHATARAVFGFPVGELRYFPNGGGVCSASPVEADYAPGAGLNDEDAIAAIGKLAGRDLDGPLTLATVKILIRHWGTVQALAMALIKNNGALNGEQISEICDARSFDVRSAAEAGNQSEASSLLAG